MESRKFEGWREAERRLRIDRDSRQRPTLPYVSCLDEGVPDEAQASTESRSYNLRTLKV